MTVRPASLLKPRLLAILGLSTITLAQNAATPPAWAFVWAPDFVAPPASSEPQHLPGSTESFSQVQARDLFFVPDWHPQAHPPMPEVVARGRRPEVRACGSCHRAEGSGGPENAGLAGLPASYIEQQMADFKSGARNHAVPQRSSLLMMKAAALAVTEEEVRAAAAYFAGLKPRRSITVLESATVPEHYAAKVFFVRQAGEGQQLLGQRIIEMPDNFRQFELRDTAAGFTAYVPPGSLARGAALVGKHACLSCHGAELKGSALVPGIAGRSPSYLFRQLYDFKHGTRAGPAAASMQAIAVQLHEDDMLAVAAYSASLAP